MFQNRSMKGGGRGPMLFNYNDVDHIIENLFLGNINAAANLSLLKKLVKAL